MYKSLEQLKDEIENQENKELDWTALILLAVFSQMEEKTDICPYCKIEKLDEKHRVLCEKCHKDLMQKLKEN